MDSTLSTELQQRLAELQAIFQQQLPGKIDEIRDSWQRLSIHWDAEELTHLHRLSHSLAGNGGTFGAHEISQAARTLEQQLKAQAAAASHPDAATQQQLQQLLTILTETCESWEPTKAPPPTQKPE
jgi:HPt (histidine-containing phosphotransfer) domain-containing protein